MSRDGPFLRRRAAATPTQRTTGCGAARPSSTSRRSISGCSSTSTASSGCWSITTPSAPTCRTRPGTKTRGSGSSSSTRRGTRNCALSIAKAFTPRVVANLEPRIRELSRQLLDETIERGEMDLAADFAVPLPMLVIAEMLGVPAADWPRYKRWSDAIVKIANTFTRDEAAARTIQEYRAVTAEMRAFLPDLIAERRAAHQDDLLTRLVEAEVDGERLTPEEVLGFVQLLLVGGQETTANLINNAVVCFLDNPDQLTRLQSAARSPAFNDRGGVALSLAGPVDAPRDAARRRGALPGDPGGEARPADDRLSEPRSEAVSRRRAASTSPATRTRTSRSGTASTRAWGRRWPAWRPGSPSPISWSR